MNTILRINDDTLVESVLVSELNVDDIVWVHGMRIQLDTTPIEYPTRYGPCRSFRGLVLNIGDIDDVFLLNHTQTRDGSGERRWTVQSNDLCRWAREINV